MALVVNTNIPSLSSQRYLAESRRDMETAMERLSSGKRINTAGDDAAGLAISQRMEAQITGLNMAVRNANDAISLTQTAEGAMQEVSDMLQRMRELAVQAVNGVNNDDDRASLDLEVQALKAEIDRIAGNTTFNDQVILDGSYNTNFQIGYNSGNFFDISLASVATSALGLAAGEASSSTDAVNTLVSSRLELAYFDQNGTGAGVDSAGISFAQGDILINGSELDAFDGTSATSSGGNDLYDLLNNINVNVDNVVASGFNTLVASSVGTGEVTENSVVIKVGAVGISTDDWYQAEKSYTLAQSSSMAEVVADINANFVNDEVVASINDDGKLVLSNTTGATIFVEDQTGTDGAFDGATGFEVGSVSNATVSSTGVGSTDVFTTAKQGFLKLTSSDGTAIEITRGNTGSSSTGTLTDLQAIGFNEISSTPDGAKYTVTGSQSTTFNGASTEFGYNTTTGQADLTINGTEIYDVELSPESTTFQGKLDVINAFSDETGVIASAYFERTIDTSAVTFVADDTFDLNGVTITMGADLDTLVTNINGVSGANTAKHGVTASSDGQNLILKGDGVQTVNLTHNDFSLSSATVQAAQRRSADTNAMDAPNQIVLLDDADVTEGRVFTLTFNNTKVSGVASVSSAQSIASNTAVTYSYTVLANEDAQDVWDGFATLMSERIFITAANSAVGSPADFWNISAGASSAQIQFFSAMDVGATTITLGVSQTGTATGTTRLTGSNSQNYEGALRLQTTRNEPISIEFNTSGNLGGLIEQNVGETTYDSNDPTYEAGVVSSNYVSGLTIATTADATTALDTLDAALASVATYRSNLGAIENRMNHTVDNLTNVVENTSAAQSRIQDADFAVEAAALARAQILQQAGTAMLAQANAAPQNVLSLLGG